MVVYDKDGERHCCYVCGNPAATYFFNVAGVFWPFCFRHRGFMHG